MYYFLPRFLQRPPPTSNYTDQPKPFLNSDDTLQIAAVEVEIFFYIFIYFIFHYFHHFNYFILFLYYPYCIEYDNLFSPHQHGEVAIVVIAEMPG